jgi:hypothetical protein
VKPFRFISQQPGDVFRKTGETPTGAAVTAARNIAAPITAPEFFPFGYAQGFGYWDRSYSDAF